MTESEFHTAAKSQTDMAVTALMQWVAEAQKALSNDKMDATARARLGELLINACRYLAEREVAAKKAQVRAEHDARPDVIASTRRMQAAMERLAGL